MSQHVSSNVRLNLGKLVESLLRTQKNQWAARVGVRTCCRVDERHSHIKTEGYKRKKKKPIKDIHLGIIHEKHSVTISLTLSFKSWETMETRVRLLYIFW